MTLSQCLDLFKSCPLVVSVQGSPGSPVGVPATLGHLAQASLEQGIKALRLEGVESIRHIRGISSAPTLGLIKKEYPGSEVYISPTPDEVQALIDLGCEVIAIDSTRRQRPGGASVPDLISRIHAAGRLAMADCDCLASAQCAVESGADLIGTTLAGYTQARAMSDGPDFDFLREAVALGRPVIAEGRYTARWQVEAALRIGAVAVVVGGAINDPVKNTRALKPQSGADGLVGLVDIGGTWIRFASLGADGVLSDVIREPLVATRQGREDWIRARVVESGVTRLAVCTGGTVDPRTGEVWEAKPIIPEHVGTRFDLSTTGVPTVAINDGLATAWGHACLPEFAGKRVATLALGTGVGAGFVERGRIWCGPRGEYPRLNDVATRLGKSVEELLGGASLTSTPSGSAQVEATEAFLTALRIIRETVYPDVVVVAGSVGLSPWLAPVVKDHGCVVSPFGHEAGLMGAAAMALYPPEF